MFSCDHRQYTFNKSFNMDRYIRRNHPNSNIVMSTDIVDHMHGVFDIRLKENFKLFVSGPSRCGKTVFVAKWYNVKSLATNTVFP